MKKVFNLLDEVERNPRANDQFNMNHLELWREISIPKPIDSLETNSPLYREKVHQVALQNQQTESASLEVPSTPYGGGPPPGWGIHQLEEHWWFEEPRYAHHPISEKMEAIGGLYHRLWPEHVEKIRNMKMENWPHRDIVEVVQEFWTRQQKQMDEKKHSMEMAQGARHQNFNEQLDHVMSPKPAAKEWNPNVPENSAPEMQKSKLSGTNKMKSSIPILSLSEFKELMQKGDTTGGERAMTPKELAIRENQDFERKNTGIINASPTEIQEEDKTELVAIKSVEE